MRGCNLKREKCESEDLMIERNLDVLIRYKAELKGRTGKFHGRGLGYKSSEREHAMAKEKK